VLHARYRQRLERICRYVLRPPIEPDHLRLTARRRDQVATSPPIRVSSSETESILAASLLGGRSGESPAG